MAGNKKDPHFIVVRVGASNDKLDTTFKAQSFDARADARDFAKLKNAARPVNMLPPFGKKYKVMPVYPGPVNRKK